MKYKSFGNFTFLILAALALSGLSSCTSEKSTSSYPISDLTPSHYGIGNFNRIKKAERNKETYVSIVSETSRNGYLSVGLNSHDQVNLPIGQSGKYGLIEQYRNDAMSLNKGSDQIFADVNPTSVIVLKPSETTPVIYKETAPQDDTIAATSQGTQEKIIKQKKDPKEMNGFGIVSLVTGIVGLYYPFLAPVAIVFGAIGLNKRQRGMAIAGLVLGIVSIVLWALILVLFISLFSGGGVY
jgi:hypothetical protein